VHRKKAKDIKTEILLTQSQAVRFKDETSAALGKEFNKYESKAVDEEMNRYEE
jgi:hypothetical protein